MSEHHPAAVNSVEAALTMALREGKHTEQRMLEYILRALKHYRKEE